MNEIFSVSLQEKKTNKRDKVIDFFLVVDDVIILIQIYIYSSFDC